MIPWEYIIKYSLVVTISGEIKVATNSISGVSFDVSLLVLYQNPGWDFFNIFRLSIVNLFCCVTWTEIFFYLTQS